MLYKILFLCLGACNTLAPAPLLSVRGYRQALDITGVAYGNNNVLLGNKILYVKIHCLCHNLGPALISVFLLYF